MATNTKYEFVEGDTVTTWDGRTIRRIRALAAIGLMVAAGDLGGYIESEASLQVSGNAWVYGDAQVYGNARVSGNAQVSGNAWVYGDAQVYGDARVYGNAKVYGDARVYGNAQVYGDARVYGNAQVYGDAWVSGNARVYGNAWVYGDAWVSGDAQILWVSKVGSENGTLTAYTSKGGGLIVTRGCFVGSDVDFLAAVASRHGKDSKIGKEYALLIEFVRMRLCAAAVAVKDVE